MPSESYTSGLNFKETELSLCLPGETRLLSSTKKPGFSENVDLTLGCSSSGISFQSKFLGDVYPSPNEISNNTDKQPPAKAQVVGWPPVKSSRMNMMIKSSKFVKVAVDGAPYLRKVDLEMYNNYKQLLAALEDMFTCLTICNVVNHKMLMDAANGMQYVPTYEDRDGDWMLVGDVPWKMFVESCKRIRLMKSSEATELPTKTSTNCSSTCY